MGREPHINAYLALDRYEDPASQFAGTAPLVNVYKNSGPGTKGYTRDPKSVYFFPCIPRKNSDFVQMWFNATGNTDKNMTKNGFFCDGWLPWDPKSEFSKHFGYPTPFCTNDTAPTDRSKVGTVSHEAWAVRISYVENNCPSFLAAATQGITVTAVASVLFTILYSLLNVLCGCTRRLRQGQSLDWKGVAKDAIDDMPVLFPSSASNFREVVDLKDAFVDLKDVVARLQREVADLKEGGFASQASAAPAEGKRAPAPRMYYPSSGGRSDVEATESELGGTNELALVRRGSRWGGPKWVIVAKLLHIPIPYVRAGTTSSLKFGPT